MSTFLRILRPLHRTPHPPSRLFSSTPTPANLARMTLIGRLAAAPEATQTASGQTIYRYAIGTSHGPRDARETSWFNVVAFAQDGEGGAGRTRLLESLEKGTLLYVEADGRMNALSIPGTTGDDGNEKTRKVLGLVQRNLQILSRPQNKGAVPEGAFAEAGVAG